MAVLFICVVRLVAFLSHDVVQVYPAGASPWLSRDFVNADIGLLEKGEKPPDGGERWALRPLPRTYVGRNCCFPLVSKTHGVKDTTPCFTRRGT